ncbi:low affinity iron permease family protein [Herbaspirillum sp. alder98]|uniref:low affinity iron permease family protein n=1 Tax=Herbaspirillum sp. alder98 TaxID=2913096 RepID=UPI001CD8E4AA|nr:low affinity iron permease family protein [Herbaspirillum sp. alder98]MCA1326699.1 low affinity iron permease family protein [Herbaspirillum sp. alder98]
MKTSDLFHQFPIGRAQAVGSPWALTVALAVIVAWAVTGPLFDYSESWQLLINTGTTIVTLLMVFLIQNAQTRDAQATRLKLDELIRAQKGARNSMLEVDDLSDEALSRLKLEFARMGEHPDDPVRQRLRRTLGRARSQGQQDQQGRPALHEAVPMAARTSRRQKQFDEGSRRLRGQQQWT